MGVMEGDSRRQKDLAVAEVRFVVAVKGVETPWLLHPAGTGRKQPG